ncbi:ribokinase [Manduca sexta]|uniref:ribokinase n=1 Tax=Manduca sexta TaxID=7130 RepID=UPI0018900DB1|nr:ribokinase [Manduca sexta]
MQSQLAKSTSSKIVVIGSCSVDFTAYAPRLAKPGETLHGYKFITSYGGKGANQCVAAAKLGGNAYMICRVGDDQWGQQYKQYLKELGVDVSHTNITPNVTTGIAQISVADNGENQIIIVPGANNNLSTSDIEQSKEVIKQADVLIGQLETPFLTTLEAFKLNNGIKILNAAPARTGIEEIFPFCTILCVNETEASILTNLEVNVTNAAIALKKLVDIGCESVVITLGQQGAVYLSKRDQQPIHVPCKNVKPVDTTGAGDAFVGALATFLVTHKDYPMHQIIGAACEVATISVTKIGTQTSYPTNFKAFTKEYEYQKI